jgi:hypothetical protein
MFVLCVMSLILKVLVLGMDRQPSLCSFHRSSLEATTTTRQWMDDTLACDQSPDCSEI